MIRQRERDALENSDLSNVVITLNAPKHLAIVKGAISGLAPDRFASVEVVLTGTTFTKSEAGVEQDGSFRFDAVVPGIYRLTLNGVPGLAPIFVAIDGFRTYEVPMVAKHRQCTVPRTSYGNFVEKVLEFLGINPSKTV